MESALFLSGYEVDGYGSCSGDSGGPIVRLLQEEGLSKVRYVQIGVVSGGLGGCREGELPAVYVRLEDEYVLGFIKAVITGNVVQYYFFSGTHCF